MSFSLLMSIYHGTDAVELDHCFASIDLQSLQPQEIVIVFDGQVEESVEACVDGLAVSRCVKTVKYSRNRGLGAALRDGLNQCSTDIVARMDTDDVCLPDRFEKQYAYLQRHPEISLVGGLLRERYVYGSEDITVERKLPIMPDKLTRFAKYRNPVNHPTVMFRKNDVQDAGSFIPFPLLEDYYLWVRMLVHGFRLANLPEVLVEARADSAYFARRGGAAYLRQEILLARCFKELGFHNWWNTVWFVVSRAPYRLMPGLIRKWMYEKTLRVQGDKPSGRKSKVNIDQ